MLVQLVLSEFGENPGLYLTAKQTSRLFVANSPSSGAAGRFQKRQFPFRVDGVRGQGLSFLNMSLTRNVGIGPSRTVQVRVDAQNLLNRQHWRNANTNPTSTTFGKVTTVTQNFMRFITFGIKLNF